MGWYAATKELEEAKKFCIRCSKQMKEGQKFYFLPDDQFSHYVCELKQVEKEHKEKFKH